MSGDYLMRFWTASVRQGKDPIMVVTFGNGIRAEVHLSRDRSEVNE